MVGVTETACARGYNDAIVDLVRFANGSRFLLNNVNREVRKVTERRYFGLHADASLWAAHDQERTSKPKAVFEQFGFVFLIPPGS